MGDAALGVAGEADAQVRAVLVAVRAVVNAVAVGVGDGEDANVFAQGVLELAGSASNLCMTRIGRMESMLSTVISWKAFKMAYVAVCCPVCGCCEVVKRGKTEDGKQRYECRRSECLNKTFILDYAYKAYVPDVKKQIIDMAMNGSGIRDTSRVLGISQNTVINEIKKQESKLQSVNLPMLNDINASQVIVRIEKVLDAELDEMWIAFVCVGIGAERRK